MTDPKLPPVQMITSDADLLRLVESLQDEPLVAVDTESNSLHAYRGQVCLIQMSTRTHDYIIDPLCIDNLQPLDVIFTNPNIEKVFHAAEYDLMILKDEFDFQIINLFDTMLATQICGDSKLGLGALIEQYFGVTVDKGHQLDDWGKRPLSEDSLQYAQMDTHYLPMIRDHKVSELQSLERMEEAQEIFLEAQIPIERKPTFNPDGFWGLGRPNKLTRRELAVIRELYFLREELAEEEDSPPHKFFPNRILVVLAKHQPRTDRSLSRIYTLPDHIYHSYGERILQAIRVGGKKPLPARPPKEIPLPDDAERFYALHSWRKQKAMDRQVEANIIISKQMLWRIARNIPESLGEIQELGLGKWRLKTYGEELLEIVRETSLELK